MMRFRLTAHSGACEQKVICELLISDATRKGYVDGRALRLPTIIVRPGRYVTTDSFLQTTHTHIHIYIYIYIYIYIIDTSMRR
jgi:hypothetical protein